MQNVHFLLGAQCSSYSVRARSYLIKKSIQYVERVPTAWTYLLSIPRRFTQKTIPVVITPGGEWLVDSNLIIDRLETEYPRNPVTPADPVHAIFCTLADAWGSEMWLPTAMGTRWLDQQQNYPWWREELGEGLWFGLPKAMKNRLCDRTAKVFSNYLSALGSAEPVVHDWTLQMMDALDRHFAVHDYILGSRASRADFGLSCPFYGHLARDVTSIPLLQDRPHLHEWVWRMQQPYFTATPPDFPPGGSPLPDTLLPIIRSIFAEMLPFAEATLAGLRSHVDSGVQGKILPRFTGPASYPMAGGTHHREGLTIILWYLQRCRDLLESMIPEDAARAKDWLHRINGSLLLELDIPRLELLGGTTLRLA